MDLDITTRGYDATISDTDIESTLDENANETITIAVVAQNVENLDTYQVRVTFDSARMSFAQGFEDNELGGITNLLKTNGGTTVGFQADESPAGTVTIANALTGTDTAEAPEGSGVIALLQFEVLDADPNNTLTIDSANFLDSAEAEDSITNFMNATVNEAAVAIDPVTDFTATAGDQQVELTWTNPTENFNGVVIVAKEGSDAISAGPTDGSAYAVTDPIGDGTVVFTSDTTDASATVTDIGGTDLENGTTYRFEIYAKDSTPNYSTMVSANATPAAIPAPVTDFTAEPGNVIPPGGTVNLSWTNPTSDGFNGVLIIYKEGSEPTAGPVNGTPYSTGDNLGGGKVWIVDAPNQSTEIDNTNPLNMGSRYYFHAYAKNDTDYYSEVAKADSFPKDAIPPNAVSNVQTTTGTSGEVGFSWENPTNGDFDGVIILYNDDGSEPTGTPTDGTAYTAGGTINGSNVGAVTTGDATSAAITGLTDGTEYNFKIFAKDLSDNYSTTGVMATATPEDAPPGPVTGFTANPGNQQVVLNWTNPADTDFAGVVIVAKEDDANPISAGLTNGTAYAEDDAIGDGFVVFVSSDDTATATITQLNGTDLANGTAYRFEIYAKDSSDQYSTMESATQTPVEDSTPPGPVTGLSATPGNQQVSLNWTNPSDDDFGGVVIVAKEDDANPISAGLTDATTYEVEDAIGDGFVVFVSSDDTATATITQLNGTALANGTAYRFEVYAKDAIPNYSTMANASATPSEFGISAPTPLPTSVNGGDQVDFAAAGGTPPYNWTFDAGTPATGTTTADDETIQWTAPTVSIGSQQVTVTVSDSSDPAKQAQHTLQVVGAFAIVDKPADAAMVESGSGYPIMLAGGDSENYAVTVTKGGTDVTAEVLAGADGEYTFTAPDTGAFAGEYLVEASDGTSTDSMSIKVPMSLDPHYFTLAETETGFEDKTFTVKGAPAGTSFTVQLADGTAFDGAGYGTMTAVDPAPAATFTYAAPDTDAYTMFGLRFVADDADLTTAGLETVASSGMYKLVPLVDYTGTVTRSDDGTALEGVKVVARSMTDKSATTDANGDFTISNLANTGDNVTYRFIFSKTGFVSHVETVKGGALSVAASVALDPLPEGSKILRGNVTPDIGGDTLFKVRMKDASGNFVQYSGADIVAYADPGDNNGAFSLVIPDGTINFTEAYELIAEASGFIPGTGALEANFFDDVNDEYTLGDPLTPVTGTQFLVNTFEYSGTEGIMLKMAVNPAFRNAFDSAESHVTAQTLDGQDLAMSVLSSIDPATMGVPPHPNGRIYVAAGADLNLNATLLVDTADPDDQDMTDGGGQYSQQRQYCYLQSSKWVGFLGGSVTSSISAINPGNPADPDAGRRWLNIPAGGIQVRDTGNTVSLADGRVEIVEDVAAAMEITRAEADADDGLQWFSGLGHFDLYDRNGDKLDANNPNLNLTDAKITLKFKVHDEVTGKDITESALRAGGEDGVQILTGNSLCEMAQGSITGVVDPANIRSVDFDGENGYGYLTVKVDQLGAYGVGVPGAAQVVVEAPTLTNLSPASGAEGSSITLTGTNFTASTSVQFGTTPATSVTYVSDTELTVVVPAGTGTVDVQACNGAQCSGTLSFTYSTARTISLSRTSGDPAGGYEVTVTSTGTMSFDDDSLVLLDGSAQTTTYNADGTLTFTMPAGTAGDLLQVYVQNLDGTESDPVNFTYTGGGGGVTPPPPPPPANPPVAAFEADVTEGCAPLEVTFSDESTGGIYSWEWNFEYVEGEDPDEDATSDDRNPTYVYTEPGMYAVQLKVTGTNGSDTETKTEYITVNACGIKANFTATPTRGDAPLTVNFTDSSTPADDIVSWEWDFDGDGETDSTEQNPEYTFETVGTHEVSLTVSDGENTDTKTMTITVTEDTGLNADFTAVPMSGPAPLDVAFTNTSTGVYTSVRWEFGDGTVSTEENPSHTYTAEGVYTVKLTIMAGIAGSDSTTQDITVGVGVKASFDASPILGIAPLEVSFTNTSSGDITEWIWDFGDGATSGEQNPTHTFTTAGKYTVTLTVSGDGATDSATREINVGAATGVTAAFTANPTSGDAPLLVSFDGSASTGDVASWFWTFGDGTTGTGASTSHTYDTAGVYSVGLTVTGANGSQDTLNQSAYITVTEDGVVNRKPAQPVLAAPANGTVDLSLQPMLETGAFADPDNDTQAWTEWQVSGSDDFGILVFWDKSEDGELTELTVPRVVLEPGMTYYWRVRFADDQGNVSDWSEVYSFTTASSDADANMNGVPDSQEVDDAEADLDEDGTADVDQMGASNLYRLVMSAVGEGMIALKGGDNVMNIEYLDALHPDRVPNNDNLEMPLGLIGYRFEVANPGDTATLMAYFSDAAIAGARWYGYNLLDGWHDFSYQGLATFSEDGKMVTLNITDGGFGDADGVENGIIVVSAAGFSQGPENPQPAPGGDGDGGSDTCFVDTVSANSGAMSLVLMALASLGAGLVRRNR